MAAHEPVQLITAKKPLIEQIHLYLRQKPISEKNPKEERPNIYRLMKAISAAASVSELWDLIVKAQVPPELIAQLVNTLDRVPAENKGLAVPMLQSVKNEKGKAEESRKEEKGEDKGKGKEKKKEEVPIEDPGLCQSPILRREVSIGGLCSDIEFLKQYMEDSIRNKKDNYAANRFQEHYTQEWVGIQYPRADLRILFRGY